jgi:F0F1-type ATP synthase assembly protein I
MSEQSSRQGEAYTALGYILAGLLFYGGLGWLGDHYLGTRFLLPAGIILGTVLSLYLVIRRYSAMDIGPTTGRRP